MNIETNKVNYPLSENEAMTESCISEEIDFRRCQKIIEAVLFAAGHPVTYQKLGDILSVSADTAKDIVQNYMEQYNAEDAPLPRGIMLIMFDTACQLCTREQYGTYIREALGIKRGGNLSQSSIEVLAVIAYNEPVTRAFVDTVRGVDSSYSISSLTEKQLIEPCGRLDVPGRPILYKTTDHFLRVFGLPSLDNLPKVDVLGDSSVLQEKLLTNTMDTETNEKDGGKES